MQEYTLTGLKTYTQYLVSLRVFNPEGDGPETIVVVMTDEGGESRRLGEGRKIPPLTYLGPYAVILTLIERSHFAKQHLL